MAVLDQAAMSDIETAHAQVPDYLRTVAREQYWTDAELAVALDDEQDAYDGLTGWIQGSMAALQARAGFVAIWDEDAQRAEFYFQDLADAALRWTGAGADKVRAYFASAAGSAELVQEAAEAAAPVTVVVGGAAGTGDDLGEIGQGLADATEEHPWLPIAIAAGVILAGLVLVTQLGGGRTIVVRR